MEWGLFMKFKFALALAAVATLTGAPATAATFDLGALGPPGLVLFGNSFSNAQNFVDQYTFTLSGPATGFGGTLAIDTSFKFNIDLSSVTLSGGGLASSIVDVTPSSFNFNNLQAGNYILAIAGDVTASGINFNFGQVGYAGSLASIGTAGGGVAATPLPAAIWMMLFGLGGLGFMGYRKRRNDGVPAAA